MVLGRLLVCVLVTWLTVGTDMGKIGRSRVDVLGN
jgi:hypothetical protein